jgi:hypothetical protein
MRELDNRLSKMDMTVVKQPEMQRIKKDKHTSVPEMLKCYICEGIYLMVIHRLL